MEQCKHKWIFQETQKKTTIETTSGGSRYAHFHRVDVYFCENCCEIKKVEQKENCSFPGWGGNNTKAVAPIWMQ